MQIDPDDQGLAFHVSRMTRRKALRLLGVGGVASLVVGCSDDDTGATGATASSGTTGSTAGSSTTAAGDSASCALLPEETAGPFPGDGSNGPDVLRESGVVRPDITTSIGSASGVAQGVPLSIELTVLSVQDGCRPLEGAAVYLWHCDREGEYSMYSAGVSGENYLRGVQAAGSDGELTFVSIFPGAYPGRWPHLHFEVYPSVDAATTAGGKLLTSQIALPEDACAAAYAAAGYEQSVRNLSGSSLDGDMVFADGYSQQLGRVTGTVADGFVLSLAVPV